MKLFQHNPLTVLRLQELGSTLIPTWRHERPGGYPFIILFWVETVLTLAGMGGIPFSGFGQRGPEVPVTDPIKIERSIIYSEEDGLVGENIRSIVETSDGFIWIATLKGLSRFDGYFFKNFTHDPNDSTSILDNRITTMIVDSLNLWIGTHLGLSRMDLRTEKFRHYQFDDYRLLDTLDKKVITRVLSLLRTREGEIWVGTFEDGLFRYLPEQDSFRCYRYPQEKVAPHFPSKRSIDRILSLTQDRFNDSIVWAGTSAGLLKINRITDEMEWFLYPEQNANRFIAQNEIKTIYQHDDGRLFYGTWHAAVNIFDPKTRQFYPLSIANNSPEEQERAFALLNRPIAPLNRKNENELWITSMYGLMTYDIPTQTWTRIQKNRIDKGIFYGVNFIDSKNRVWFSGSNGLHLFDPVLQQFIEYDYGHLNPDFNGYSYYFLAKPGADHLAVLPRSSEGIYFLHPDENQWELVRVPKKYVEAGGDFVPRGFSLSPTGQWTIITLRQVINFDPVTKTFASIPLPPELQEKSFRSVLWDRSGRLWLGLSIDGIIRWTPKQNKWELLNEELKVQHPEVEEIGIITEMFEDSQGNIWLNRSGGFSVYDLKRDTFFSFVEKINPRTSFEPVLTFTEDQQGRVWLLSNQSRVGYANIQELEKGIIEKLDYRASHQISYFLYLKADANGKLWSISEDKLYQIDPDTKKVISHSLNYGVSETDEYFGFDILPNGRIAVGGRNKIWLGSSANFMNNEEKPLPYLTGISILQEPVQADVPIHLISDLKLKPKENFFSFEFSSVAFIHGDENVFRYRLKHFDDTWTKPEKRRFANFTNVPSGDYVFELQVANNEGVWNEAVYSLPVSIATPWWMTTWFWSLLGLFLFGLFYLAYRWRINEVRREERLHSEYKNKLTEMEMSALRAQMNPHFIFNAMNSIEYFIINNEPEKASDYLNRFSRLIRLILQNSNSTIVPLKDDLEALKLYIEIESTRFDGLFDYEIKVQEDLDMEKIKVPPMLIQPFVENAIWHGLIQKKEERGKIDLTIREGNRELICLIEDNGIGREAAENLKSKSATRKKSFGMKITSSRLDALNELAGTKASVQIFDLKNEIGTPSGTRVELVIPL